MSGPPVLDPATALPAAYAPFLPVIERLSDPLQQLLRGQLLQFERHFRLSDREQLAQKGEFEGLGGLTTRGDVAYMVQSELLLRTQAPLEFLRRLAEAETLFHEKRYADPGARHAYRIMISCGPGLLGHGRILALAALFFVARIAHQRRASFHWCTLPRADGPVWFTELSVNTVKRFLRAASFREMTLADCAEAVAVSDAVADTSRGDVRTSDWVIGEQPPALTIRRDARTSAAALASNTLGFALAAPIPGQRRMAQMFLREDGWERSRLMIAFPDDRLCVSALANPFQPFRPAVSSKAAEAMPARPGWEPHYLLIPNPQIKIVRLCEGILILNSPKREIARKWFVPLPRDVVLAGIKVDHQLTLLLYSRDDEGDLLTYYLFALNPGRDPVALLRRQTRSTISQLFRNRSPHAIPIITTNHAIEFYGVSGRPLELRFDQEHQATDLVWLHKVAPILLATGTHRVVKDLSGSRPLLRALKGHRMRGDVFIISDDLPDRLHGLVYSPGERGLAYSLRAGSWTVPFHGDESERTIQLAPGETLLSGKWQSDGVSARIWSDARYGGNGTVRTVRRDDDGQETSRRPMLKLGPDALSIAAIQFSDDGIWSVVVDEEGYASTLLQHQFNKRTSHYDERRHDLGDLRKDAVVIDLSRFHG